MKKKILFIAIMILPALILSGCAPVVKDGDIPENFDIYASFLPVYMLSDMIIGENIPGMNKHLLVQPQDGCMRDYQLSDWDAYMLMSADAVILIGNGFETFESALMSMGEGGPAVVSLSSNLTLDRSGEGETEESHLNGANPWLFLSADGGAELAESIAAGMMALDPDYEDGYVQNLNNAKLRFDDLKKQIGFIRENIDTQKRVALMHEGLIYTANDFGLNVVLRIDRESGEYPDGAFLSEIMDKLSKEAAEVVLIEMQAPDALLEALTAAGYDVVCLDTLSSGKPLNAADAYFERILGNARAIEKTFKK